MKFKEMRPMGIKLDLKEFYLAFACLRRWEAWMEMVLSLDGGPEPWVDLHNACMEAKKELLENLWVGEKFHAVGGAMRWRYGNPPFSSDESYRIMKIERALEELFGKVKNEI